MERYQRIRIIMFIIAITFVIGGTFASYRSNDFSLLNDENSRLLKKESFKPNLSVQLLDRESIGLQEYFIQFKKSELEHIKSDKFMIFLNKLTDNAYSVSLNDEMIFSEGDMEKGRSTLKASLNYFVLDRGLIKDNNELKINTYANYKTGLDSEGVYITDCEVGRPQARKLDVFGSNLMFYGLGFLMFSTIFMIFIYFLNRRKNIGVLYSAIATIFLQIYLIDYLKITYLKYDYIIYKKIFLSALHIGLLFYALAMNSFYKCFYFKLFSGITAVSFVIIALLVNDFILFKTLYQYWYVMSLVNLILAFIYSLINIKKSEEALAFTLLFASVFIYAAINIFTETMDYTFRLNAPFIYIINTSMLPILFGIRELTKKERELSYQKALSKKEYINAITDNLTGVFNRRYLYNRLEEKAGEIIVAMIDIDHFKEINDNFGHITGDYILKELTALIKGIIRGTDDICRYGGDEFIVIFYSLNEKEILKRMEELRKLIEKYEFEYGDIRTNITVSIGIYKTLEKETYGEILEKVDNKLYASKESGRNRVEI